jgi:outer membrane protein assembly factor BamB
MARQPQANYVGGIAALAGRVFIATIDDETLRAYDASTGKLLWKFKADGGLGKPTLAEGSVFIQSNLGTIYAIDPASGHPRWSIFVRSSGANVVSVSGTTVYVPGGDERFVSAYTTSGTLLWTTPTDSTDNGAPVLADGMVLQTTTAGTLYALDQATGAVDWMASTASGMSSTPAVANGSVYVVDYDGSVYAFSETDGTQLWASPTRRAGGLNSATVANGVVYAATIGVYAFDAQTGELLWSSRTEFTNAEVCILDGEIYVPDFSGTLRAYSLPSG